MLNYHKKYTIQSHDRSHWLLSRNNRLATHHIYTAINHSRYSLTFIPNNISPLFNGLSVMQWNRADPQLLFTKSECAFFSIKKRVMSSLPKIKKRRYGRYSHSWNYCNSKYISPFFRASVSGKFLCLSVKVTFAEFFSIKHSTICLEPKFRYVKRWLINFHFDSIFPCSVILPFSMATCRAVLPSWSFSLISIPHSTKVSTVLQSPK